MRQLVGYDRYSSKAALTQLEHLYPLVRDYLNFCQPMRKLQRKHRVGAKVTKHYDTAQTPYQRLQRAGVLDVEQRVALQVRYHRLNPAHLKREIDATLDQLWRLAERPGAAQRTGQPAAS